MKHFENRAVRFEIPAGWEDGSSIRFAGPAGGSPFPPTVTFVREDTRATVLTYALEQIARLTPELPQVDVSALRNTSLAGVPACEVDMHWVTPDGPISQRRTYFQLGKKMWSMTASSYRGTFEQNAPIFAQIASSVVLAGAQATAQPVAVEPARPPSQPPPFAPAALGTSTASNPFGTSRGESAPSYAASSCSS